jgi:hypothetical protein
MARIKGNNNKCWVGCGKSGALKHCWWELNLVEPLWKTLWRVLEKLDTKLPYDLLILLLCINPNDCEVDRAETPVHRCSLQHFWQKLSSGNSLDPLQLKDWWIAHEIVYIYYICIIYVILYICTYNYICIIYIYIYNYIYTWLLLNHEE